MDRHGCTNLMEAACMVQRLALHHISAAHIIGYPCYESIWDVDGYKWGVYFYPAVDYTYRDSTGRRIHRRQEVALELVFHTGASCSSDGVKASLTCRMVDPRGVLDPSQGQSVSRTFSISQDCTSPLFLGTASDLAALGSLKDDSLTVECTIAVFKDLAPVKELQQHFGELLQKETGTDVTFVVSGESFAAHKVILAARSPVFMAELFAHMKEATSGRVVVEDMEPAAFKAMLHFIYTDTVPELDHEQEASATTMAMHLLVAADRYGLDKLKLICAGMLSVGIGVDTAAATLALAEQHGCSLLKAKCVEFIVRTPANLAAVMATEEFNHLEVSCPSLLT